MVIRSLGAVHFHDSITGRDAGISLRAADDRHDVGAFAWIDGDGDMDLCWDAHALTQIVMLFRAIAERGATQGGRMTYVDPENGGSHASVEASSVDGEVELAFSIEGDRELTVRMSMDAFARMVELLEKSRSFLDTP